MQTVDHWYFSLVKRSARHQSAIENGSEIVFPLCWQIKAVVLFILAGYGLVFFALINSRPVPGDPWYLKQVLVLIFGAIPVAILLALPGRVVTDSSSIRQRYWWRPERAFPGAILPLLSTTEFYGSTIVYQHLRGGVLGFQALQQRLTEWLISIWHAADILQIIEKNGLSYIEALYTCIYTA